MDSPNKTLLSICAFFIIAHLSCFAQGPHVVIPVPAEVKINKGVYKYDTEPQVKTVLVEDIKGGPEAYEIKVTGKGVTVRAATEAGIFYARQTMRQMTGNGTVKEIQCCEIKDFPRFEYRGLHVDVSRHFRSIDFLKKQIDAMARFKMNRMHIHLTDAAGWRLQIEKYPRLTEFAAWRPQLTWKEWWAGERSYCEEGTPGAYGGYYTKDDIRELLDYAKSRFVEIIPEIELPSHSEEVLAAYPQLGCSQEAYKDSEFCVGNEDSFKFLESVLAEVIDLFPSEYIHIGGDEAGKQHWKTCEKCQQRMLTEGFDSVDQLQSYMVQRIEKFVNSKGRKIIGWDEILDGGLAPNAAVMSWRGTEGGIKAMSMGHDVIMTPGRYCYLDHTQDAPFREPESIGGYLPLDTVYVYEPVEASMPSDKIHHLKGIQANLWSEYVVTDAHAEYMYWPRAFAVAETAWSQPQNKNIDDFRSRALHALDVMSNDGYNVFDLQNEYGERKLAQTGLSHKARGKKVIYNKPIQQWYPASGESTFTDGVIGGWTYSDNRWQGFLSDIDVTIDLGELTQINYVGGTFMQLIGPGVFMPQKVDVLVSENGSDFTLVSTIWNDVPTSNADLLFKSFDVICDTKARFVRYHAYRSPMRGFLFLDEVLVN